MIRRRLIRVAVWSLAALVLLAAAGFLWLRQSPYWAGITLFSESHRVENFRDMGRVFPARTVPRGETVWAFDHAPQPLPDTYTFGGQDRSLAAFLDRTRTTGLLVVHRGAITHEEYRLGADETSPFTSWSAAKSVLSALIGIAVEEGHIASIRDPIGQYVPALAGSGYGVVPIEDALTMSSGMAFDEDYDNPFSDINMLVWRAMAMGQPVEVMLAGLGRLRDPGTCNDYISSDSMAPGLVLGLVVLEAATGAPVAEDLASRLWGPTAAEADASWSTDRTGRECAPCFLNATLRDNARFGRLFLDGGVRDGRQIVPADWLHASVNPTDAQLQSGQNPASNRTFGYGYQWWIPKEPQGDFAAIGVWGQSAPAAAGPKTMRFAHASPLVAGKGMIP
ncbi:MAG: serine hydrolase [Rubellimicrobium sp.]|nr:serine hydrolase [Rubellimicrobium sp.]